jgi:hypothetical protein
MRRAHCLALLAGLTLAACGGGSAVPPADRARAVQIADAGDLVGGPKAAGQVGDFLLANTKVRFVVAAAGRTRAWLPVGGLLLDADRVRAEGGDDRLQEMATRLGTLRILYADAVEVANDGSDGKPAVVRVTGHDVGIPIVQAAAFLPSTGIAAVTEYRLEPYAESLEITTTVTNVGTRDQTFPGGDIFALGDFVTLFVPGYGTDSSKFGLASDVRYLAAFGGSTSYAYFAPGRGVSLLAAVDEIVGASTQSVSVPVGGSATFTRYLAVGAGDVASLLPEIVRREGGDPAALGTIGGTVTEQGGAPVAGALVAIDAAAKPYAVAVAGVDGTWRARLETGSYSLGATAAARTGVPRAGVDLAAGAVLEGVDLQLSDAGAFAIQVDDAAGAPCPARVRFYDGDGAEVAYYLSADGRGGGVLPPGDYQAVVTRGFEWEAATVPVTVAAGQTATVAATLERVVDTAGFVAIDSHTHTGASIDSGLDPYLRVRQALADGVEVVVATDHDVLFDLAPMVRELGVTGQLVTVVGSEVSPINGHLNGFPLVGGPAADTDGYWAVRWWAEDARHDYVEDLWPKALFAALRDKLGAEVVEMNHPRSSQGILTQVEYDPIAGLAGVDPDHFDMTWDVLEICNSGCDPDPDSEDSRARRDYYSFLNQGYLRGAVGVSDNHGSSAWLGHARTLVQVPDDEPSRLDLGEVWAALKAGRAVVVAGPFVTAAVWDDGGAEVGMGGLARVAGSEVRLHVRVQAPSWVPTDRLRVVANGAEVSVVTIPGGGPLRFDADVVLPAPAADTWYVVVVEGDAAMAPALPGKRPLAVTNAVFVDRDGNGIFDAPGL